MPLVLHLLNRSRYRNVDWGAMMFLDGVEPRQSHSTRFKQWGLLALRTLILSLLAVALARPVIRAGGLPPARPGRTAAVILLDRSASMSLNDTGRVRLDLAREAIFQLLSPGFHRGDDLWLIPLGAGEPAAAPSYASDPQVMANLVKEVTVASGEADVAAGLRAAIDLLSTAEAPNREIYVVCDRQASSWRGVEEEFLRDWRRRMTPLPGSPRLFVVPVGTSESDNVAVEAIHLLRWPLVADQPADVEVRLHNYGSVPRGAVPLTVEIQAGGPKRLVRHMAVNIPAAGIASAVVSITFSNPGSNVISARIDAPGTATDKQLDYSVEVLKDFHALIVDGDEREGSLQNGADFLRLALSPYANPKRNTAGVTVLRPEAWGAAELRDIRVLVLANVPSVTESQAEAIQQFVYGGGGLIVAPGDQSRIDNYNVMLPWLPGALQPAIADSGATATTLGDMELTHPIFGFLEGRPEPAPAAVRRYFPATPRAGASVLGSYADGKPFVIESAAGRGRVLLMTTPVDTDWNALPLTRFFLPFAQSMLRYAGAGPSVEQAARRNLSPGQEILADFDEPLDSRNVVVTGPLGRVEPADVMISQFGTSGEIRCARTFAPGIYRVLPQGMGDLHPVQFAVRTPAAESNLTPLPEDRWRWLERELRVEGIDSERRTPAVSQEIVRGGIDLWLPLLGGAIVLSMIELSATRRWAGREA